MKKVLFLIVGFALGYAVLGGFEPTRQNWDFDFFSSNDQRDSSAYVAKYRDCIAVEDFPPVQGMETFQGKGDTSRKTMGHQGAVAEYARQMGATLRNLNHLDAHNHIHQEFQRSKDSLLQPGLGEAQRLYHLQIMDLCFENDKALNLGTPRQL